MNEEFNIFKNLDDLRKTNLLDQLKSLESAKPVDLNDSQGLDIDFDEIVNNNCNKESPAKRQCQKVKSCATPKTKPKKKSKSRRTSTSTDGSVSPTLPLLENLSNKVVDIPVSRRTRRSLRSGRQITEAVTILENIEPSSSNGRGRRGKGRGRGRGKTSSAQVAHNSTNFSESSLDLTTNTLLNEISAHESVLNYTSPNLSIMDRFLQQGRNGRSRCMRARRQYVAELAARSTQVDFIDLVSSPMPRVEGFIDLVSDTGETTKTARSKKDKNLGTILSSTKDLLDISFDEDNPELNIKVNWKGKTEAFKLRKYQKFSRIFQQLADRENIGTESIVLNLNDRIIMADDTPDAINYKIYQFIDGRVLSNCFNLPGGLAAVSKHRDANKISLKIQSDEWKRPLHIDIMKTDKFRILYIKCAEELKVGLDQLKLSFDGEVLEINDTPADLDLEGGEAIDLRIK